MPALLLGPLLRHVTPTSATVWVETDAPATVEVTAAPHSATARTVRVNGHHYALVVLTGLEPGTATSYEVHLDGVPVWPQQGPDGGEDLPPSRIRTPSAGGAVRVVAGSCRRPEPLPEGGEPDGLDALAGRLARTDPASWPDLLLLLGDQVYADEVSAPTRRRIDARRAAVPGPVGQVADFEEYTWLYAESWSGRRVRWLLSTVPNAMIFDDHDVHDDWNTSRAWRATMRATSWWPERIAGALASYWVYQHLGNMSPAELDGDPTWQALLALPHGGDGGPVLRELAVRADAESDGAKGYRWSFARDLGRVRVVVVDSRCGRILDGGAPGARSMIGPAEAAWPAQALEGDYDHLLLGTSLPWLLAPALHDVEAWDERLAADARPRVARFGERLRQGADLEHWAAFGASFDRLAALLRAVASGGHGWPAPASVAVLSGDVHHSYVARARWPGAPVFQVTCSPLNNAVPVPVRWAFRLAWSRTAERTARLVLGRLLPGGLPEVPAPVLRWDRLAGPFFGNAVAALRYDGRRAALTLETAVGNRGDTRVVTALDLTGDPPPG